MRDIAIVTDSTSDLPDEFIKANDIQIIPLQVNCSNKTYKDKIEITYEEIYVNLDKEIPTTSLPFAEDVIDVFERLKANNIKNVVGLFLSSNLSGTYNLISQIAKDYLEYMNIKLIDTKTISMGIGHAVIQAANAVKLDKSFDEVVDIAVNTVKNTRTFFMLDTLTYLIKGGRIGKVSGVVGNILNIKPIIGVDEIDTGQYYTIKKVRGRNIALKTLNEIVQKLIDKKKECVVAIADAIAKDDRDKVYDIIKSNNNNIKDFIKTSVTPVIAVHTGPGLVGISIYCKEGLDDLRAY